MIHIMNNTLQSTPLLDFSRSDPNKGTLFDVRDGQSYPVVKIGKQIWLAENFRYLPSLEKGDPYCNSWVYDNDNKYLDKGYGRLYDWDTAMNIAPEGWRLPSNEDFEELKDFIIKDNKLNEEKNSCIDSRSIGCYLKSVKGWNPYEGIVNNDKYGFSAKPAGYCSYIDSHESYVCSFHDEYFWSTTVKREGASNWGLYDTNKSFYCINNTKTYGLSVRLVKDI